MQRKNERKVEDSTGRIKGGEMERGKEGGGRMGSKERGRVEGWKDGEEERRVEGCRG